MDRWTGAGGYLAFSACCSSSSLNNKWVVTASEAMETHAPRQRATAQDGTNARAWLGMRTPARDQPSRSSTGFVTDRAAVGLARFRLERFGRHPVAQLGGSEFTGVRPPRGPARQNRWR